MRTMETKFRARYYTGTFAQSGSVARVIGTSVVHTTTRRRPRAPSISPVTGVTPEIAEKK